MKATPLSPADLRALSPYCTADDAALHVWIMRRQGSAEVARVPMTFATTGGMPPTRTQPAETASNTVGQLEKSPTPESGGRHTPGTVQTGCDWQSFKSDMQACFIVPHRLPGSKLYSLRNYSIEVQTMIFPPNRVFRDACTDVTRIDFQANAIALFSLRRTAERLGYNPSS